MFEKMDSIVTGDGIDNPMDFLLDRSFLPFVGGVASGVRGDRMRGFGFVVQVLKRVFIAILRFVAEVFW